MTLVIIAVVRNVHKNTIFSSNIVNHHHTCSKLIARLFSFPDEPVLCNVHLQPSEMQSLGIFLIQQLFNEWLVCTAEKSTWIASTLTYEKALF